MSQKLISILGSFVAETAKAINDNFAELFARPSGGVPGGADTQVQLNDGGVFGGSPNFTFSNPTTAPELNVHGGFFIHGDTTSTGFGFLDDADSFVGEFDAVGGSLALSNVSFQQVLYADASETDFGTQSLPTSVFGTTITMGGPLITPTHTPSSATDTGIAGQFAWDADFIYICTATNTWKRVGIATWP